MATNNLDLVKFVVRNIADPKTGQYTDLDKIDADIKKIFAGAKSAVNADDFIGIRNKIIDEVTGEMYVEIVTEAKNAMNVGNALQTRTSATGRYSVGNALDVQSIKGFRTFTSKEASRLAEANVTSAGGVFYHAPTLKNPNRYAYEVPVDNPNNDPSINSALRKTLFGGQTGKIESVSKQQAKEADAVAQEKERVSNLRHLKGNVAKGVALLTVLASVVRRILSVVMDRASEVQKGTTEAHNLGIAYRDVRKAQNAEVALGLSEGTVTGAMSDIQSKFGNITMIDEGALANLALIMGSEIEDLVRSGIGGKNPEQLLERIVDSFNARANQGYNSVGQYVGEAQARRELYSLLNKVSPQIASIFATLNEAQNNPNSIYRGVKGYKDLIEATQPDRLKLTEKEEGLAFTLSELNNSVKSLWKQMKDAITVTLAPNLISILEKLANSRVFMDAEDSLALDIENREKNKAFISTSQERIETIKSKLPQMTEIQRIEANSTISVLTKFVEQAEKQNKKEANVADVAKTATEARIAYLAGLNAKSIVQTQLNQPAVGRYRLPTADFSAYKSDIGKAPFISYFGSEEAYQTEVEKIKNEILSTQTGYEKYVKPYSEERKAIEEQARKDAEELYPITKGMTRKEKKATEQKVSDYVSEALAKQKEQIMSTIPEDVIMEKLLQKHLKLKSVIDEAIARRIDIETQTFNFLNPSADIPVLRGDTITGLLQKAGKSIMETYGLIGSNSKAGSSDNVYRLVLDINNNNRLDEGDIELFKSDKGFTGQAGKIGTYSNNIVNLSAVKE